MPDQPDSEPGEQVTRLIAQLGAGDRVAADQLLPLVYGELRSLAAALFAGQHANHTLQPTALVNEAWIKLARGQSFDGRRHFLAVAGRAMRQVLIDHARARRAVKRGDQARRVALDEEGIGGADGLDVLALDDALAKLGAANERYVQVFELRFLAGLSSEEVAAELGVTQRTVQLDWRAVRSFLQKELVTG